MYPILQVQCEYYEQCCDDGDEPGEETNIEHMVRSYFERGDPEEVDTYF